jgi:hypothetical protein
MILLIFKIISEDENKSLDYLFLNNKFNSIILENGTSLKLYLGSQLLYSYINLSENKSSCHFEMEIINENKTIKLYDKESNYYVSKDDIICFNKSNLFLRDSSSKIIDIIFFEKEDGINIIPCNDSLTIDQSYKCLKDKTKILMETAYGEIIFIRKPFITYNILLIGFFIILNGSIHKVLGIIFHVTLSIYFFIKDIVELCGGFSYYYHIPLLIFVASLITGILFSFYIYLQDNKLSCYKDKVLKTAYGILFCFFTFKSIFYYLTFFFGLNSIVYVIFLIIFTLGGICLGLGFSLFLYEKLDKYSKYLYISCSAVSGSFFIVKSFGYIVGGYYSDIIISKYNSLEFDGDCKGKVILFFFIQIFLIIGSVYYQIKNEKYRNDEEIESVIRSSDLSTRQTFLSKDSNINTDDDNTNSINNNESNSNQNDGEGDDDNDINDQED